MSNQNVLFVKNLHKIFKIYSNPRQMLKELLLGGKRHTEYHALQDISFEVKQGEIVGVMGRNGAGKSTLLRILAGTLDATSGIVEKNGRISAILELGTGFRADYTGRENIFSGGLVLGMSKEEIEGKVEKIIEFSELRDFIDQPFKTYSSGMQARLTFATAISVNPDILIVDEALSVGDASFQSKCYAKIQQFRENGGSIFLVTHAENVITQFCDRALLLEKGKLLMDALPREVTMAYCDMVWAKKELEKEREAAASNAEFPAVTQPRSIEKVGLPAETPAALLNPREKLRHDALQRLGITPFIPSSAARRLGNAKKAEVLDFKVINGEGKQPVRLERGEKYKCVLTVLVYEQIEKLIYGFIIRNTKGLSLFGASCMQAPGTLPIYDVKPGDILSLCMDFTCNITNTHLFFTGSVASVNGDGPQIFDGFLDGIEFEANVYLDIQNESLIFLQQDFSHSKLYLQTANPRE